MKDSKAWAVCLQVRSSSCRRNIFAILCCREARSDLWREVARTKSLTSSGTAVFPEEFQVSSEYIRIEIYEERARTRVLGELHFRCYAEFLLSQVMMCPDLRQTKLLTNVLQPGETFGTVQLAIRPMHLANVIAHVVSFSLRSELVPGGGRGPGGRPRHGTQSRLRFRVRTRLVGEPWKLLYRSELGVISEVRNFKSIGGPLRDQGSKLMRPCATDCCARGRTSSGAAACSDYCIAFQRCDLRESELLPIEGRLLRFEFSLRQHACDVLLGRVQCTVEALQNMFPGQTMQMSNGGRKIGLLELKSFDANAYPKHFAFVASYVDPANCSEPAAFTRPSEVTAPVDDDDCSPLHAGLTACGA